jgi:acetoacetate decarboxylase
LTAANFGGWIFEDARFLAAQVELDPRCMQARLPFGLRLSRPATATLFVAHFPKTSFGSVYSEAGLFVDVCSLVGRAAHCPWMLVDDDIALITGRELVGYPKKMGSFEIDWGDEQIHACVERRGVELFRMDARLGGVDRDPPPMLGRLTLNVSGTMGFSPQQLIAFRPREQVVEARHADLTLQLGASERDPLDELGLGAVQSAHFYRVHIGGRLPPLPIAPVSPLFWITNFSLRFQ